MVGNAENRGGQGEKRWRSLLWAAAPTSLLLIPLVAMQFSDEWNWGVFDFVFGFVVLFATGFTYEMLARKADGIMYKLGVGVAVVAALLLVWVNAAVGIIGDDEAVNLLYLGVLVIGLLGAFLARFEPQGMARALFAMAITQLIVPLIVFLIPDQRALLMEPPGVWGVIALNLFFALPFVVAGLLFRKAALDRAEV